MGKKNRLENDSSDLRRQERRFNCYYLGSNMSDKLSGGFYDQHYIPESSHGWICHEYFAITYILEGHGVFAGHDDARHHYTQGTLVFRHPGQKFFFSKHYTENGQWLEFSAALPATLHRTLVESGIISTDLSYLDIGISPHVLSAANRYIDSLSFFNRHGGRCMAYSAFLELLAAFKQAAHYRTQPLETDEDLLIEKARELLSHDIPNLNMPEFARNLGLGYDNFRKKFQRKTGLPPHEYHILCRLDRADALLLHTRLSIKEIAEKLGYSSISGFTRQYTRFRRHPPSHIRSNQNGMIS